MTAQKLDSNGLPEPAEEPDKPETSERHCILMFKQELIERMPWFPPNARIRTFYLDYPRRSLGFCVEGYGPIVSPDEHLPMVAPDEVVGDDGVLYALRWPGCGPDRALGLPSATIEWVTNHPEDGPYDIGFDGRATRDIREGETIKMPLCVYQRIRETGSAAPTDDDSSDGGSE